MASIKHYANGLGGTTGSLIATGQDVQVSGAVYYVGNAVAGASDANAGTERTKPWLTASKAATTCANNDTIVFLAGHNEAITVSVVWNKVIRIVGEGSGSTVPRFTCGAGIAMFDVTSPCVYMDNFYFPASTAAPTARIRITGDGFFGNSLRLDSGANDTTPAMLWSVAASNMPFILTGCTWTSVAATPSIGLSFTTSTAEFIMDNCTFDGWSFGWTDYAWKSGAATFGMTVTRLNLLAGSNVLLPTTSNGYIQTESASGDSVINWTA